MVRLCDIDGGTSSFVGLQSWFGVKQFDLYRTVLFHCLSEIYDLLCAFQIRCGTWYIWK